MDKVPARKVLGLLLAGLIWCSLQCGDPGVFLGNVSEGGGNESPNAFIKGTTAYKAAPASDLSGIEVTLFKVDIELMDTDPRIYLWEPVAKTHTDSVGGFFFTADSVADTLASQYAITVEKDAGNKSFSGYFKRRAAKDSVLKDTLLIDKTKCIEGMFTDRLKVADWVIINGQGDTTAFNLQYITIKLIGTRYACQVKGNGAFTLNDVPAHNFKMEVNYKALVNGSDLVLPHYTAFIGNIKDPTNYTTEPFVQQDTIFITGDIINIRSKDYIITYTIKDN